MNLLRVRRLEAADLPIRVEWFNTPSVYNHMVIDVPISLADTQNWFSRNALSERRRDFSFVACHDETEERIAAMGGLTDVNLRHRNAELYIVVAPPLTGHGIGRRATEWLCNYGFSQLNLNRIYLYTVASNHRARSLYERLGFTFEGILRGHMLHNGEFIDRHIQALLRKEWQQVPWRLQGTLEFEVNLGQS